MAGSLKIKVGRNGQISNLRQGHFVSIITRTIYVASDSRTRNFGRLWMKTGNPSWHTFSSMLCLQHDLKPETGAISFFHQPAARSIWNCQQKSLRTLHCLMIGERDLPSLQTKTLQPIPIAA